MPPAQPGVIESASGAAATCFGEEELSPSSTACFPDPPHLDRSKCSGGTEADQKHATAPLLAAEELRCTHSASSDRPQTEFVEEAALSSGAAAGREEENETEKSAPEVKRHRTATSPQLRSASANFRAAHERLQSTLDAAECSHPEHSLDAALDTHQTAALHLQGDSGCPLDSQELATLFEDLEAADEGRDCSFPASLPGANGGGTRCSHPPAVPVDAAAYTSLLGGSLSGAGARRSEQASKPATCYSQQQAAALFCLSEQLLRQEAAAGRLTVREQPNPHSSSFRPMRLYDAKEVEDLAVQIWGSLEGARAARERRIEERWQRKKRGTVPQPFTAAAKRKRKGLAAVQEEQAQLQATELYVCRQPARRDTEAKWEKV
ncbi:uncharacterized protein LOC34618931 [Cyclospora cayetanensis]|uniref:Uncharacterized protein LOC34618931 n=1 Tax=Cyclospora cayetanensis TaxID=88456 RepID=A0A6P6RXZ6_9EIME|nr:uncharacterized protein LOC34618931 [Cyclospora cayetanensis]